MHHDYAESPVLGRLQKLVFGASDPLPKIESTALVPPSMSEERIKWLHISDFHYGKDEAGFKLLCDEILAEIQRDVQAFGEPLFVFITGDLANKGKKDEYEGLMGSFLLQLLDIFDSKKTRIYCLPGNHDVDRDEEPLVGRDEILADETWFDATEAGQRKRARLIKRFSNFIANDLTEAGRSKWIESISGTFSDTVSHGDLKISIIGINTSWLCAEDKEEGKLTPGFNLVKHAIGSKLGFNYRIVLGHHPLDWFHIDERKKISALFSKHDVIYIHGHLHHSYLNVRGSPRQPFITVQAGAAFQNRSNHVWRNGFTWGEIRPSTNTLHLKPLRWNTDHQNWTLDTDAYPGSPEGDLYFSFPLRAVSPAEAAGVQRPGPITDSKLAPTAGWRVVSLDELDSKVVPLSAQKAVKFFDGAVPTFSVALSSSIPRRQVVRQLVDEFQNIPESDQCRIRLVTGYACEGKTTVLFQSAHEIIKKNTGCSLLFREDMTSPLPRDFISALCRRGQKWLVVIDEVDQIAGNIFEALQRIPTSDRRNVHFIIACRITDWNSQGAKYEWASVCNWGVVDVKGLNSHDADAIVGAWTFFGQDGLGKLLHVNAGDRENLLLQKCSSDEECASGEGAFFGALLAVRHGDDLKEHAASLLASLQKRTIGGEKTLLDAIAFISAMHVEDQNVLSREVLATALGCDQKKLHRDVIWPLGQEAAATHSARFLSTRHRKIAHAFVNVLSDKCGYYVPDLYPELAAAAIIASRTTTLAVNLTYWRHSISRHFSKTDRHEIAIEVAEAVYKQEPTHQHTITNLSKLYRAAGRPAEALGLFTHFGRWGDLDVGSLVEWAAAENQSNGNANAAVLCLAALADKINRERLKLNSAQMALSTLFYAYLGLYSSYGEQIFKRGAIACRYFTEELGVDWEENRTDEGDSQVISVEELQISEEQAWIGFHEARKHAATFSKSPHMSRLVSELPGLAYEEFEDLIGNFGGRD